MQLYQPTITGSLSVSGSINLSGSITIAGGGTISGTASIATNAITASSADNFLVRNTLTAQTLVVQTITSSVDFVTGSTRFGSLAANTHVFTGSVLMTGSVGINVASPSNLLHLAGASATPSLRLGSISTGFHWDIGRENATTGDFIFNNANGGSTTEKVRITTGGNVGIGTPNPINILHVSSSLPRIIADTNTRYSVFNLYHQGSEKGAFYLDNTNKEIIVETNGDNTYALVLRTAAAERMRITSAGSVGIGTTNPASLLHAQIPSVTSTSTEIFRLTDGTLCDFKIYLNRGTDINSSVSVVNTYAGIMSFQTNNTDRMRITSAGNLGIGNTNARTRLQVTPTSNAEAPVLGTATGVATFTSANTNYGLQFNSTSDGTFFIQSQRFDNSAVAYNLSLQPVGGGVYIGGSSMANSQRLGVIGSGVWEGSSIGMQNTGTGGITYTIFSTNNQFGQGGGNLLFYNVPDGRNNLILYANGNYDFAGSDVSDRRLKQDIENINFGLNEIMQLSPKSYHLKSEDNLQGEHQTTLRKRYGFIAQEVQSILPDAITGEETETEYLGLDYNGVLTVTVKALQELKAEFDAYKTTHP